MKLAASLTANVGMLYDLRPLAPAVEALPLSFRILIKVPKPKETFDTDIGTHVSYIIGTHASYRHHAAVCG